MHLSQLAIQLYVQVKLVVTVISLIAPPKSPGQDEQVTLPELEAQAAHPVGHATKVTVVFTLFE